MTYTPKTFPRLVDLAVTALACSVHLHDSITLPDELTAKLLRTMHRKKVLNDETVDKILHRDIRTMNLSGCQDIDVLAVSPSIHTSHCLTTRWITKTSGGPKMQSVDIEPQWMYVHRRSTSLAHRIVFASIDLCQFVLQQENHR